MDINEANIRGLTRGFNTSFNKGFSNVQPQHTEIAMTVPSTASVETYAWLQDMPGIREWIGDRIVHDLAGHAYSIENKLFEETVGVKRTAIEDDRYGIYGPMMEKLGADAALHPDLLTFTLLGTGYATRCYDGQYFFDTDHPVGMPGNEGSVSNVQDGTGRSSYLLDCRQPMRPLIYQKRLPYTFTQVTDDSDERVFFKDEFVWGSRGRSNVGFGFWQMAFASKANLTDENLYAGFATMADFKSDNGRPLGIRPSHIVVPPQLEWDARKALERTLVDASSNPLNGVLKIVVSPYLV